MDSDAVNKIVAAILAGHATAATGQSTQPSTYVDKYRLVLKILESHEKEDEEKNKGRGEFYTSGVKT